MRSLTANKQLSTPTIGKHTVKLSKTFNIESVGKEVAKHNAIERFNCTLGQRVARLVRKTPSFLKKIENRIEGIKYFICHYNKEVIRHV